MSDPEENDTQAAFEKALENSKNERYLLRLYIAGNTHQSANTIMNLRKVCEEYLQGRYQLEVVDIYQQPSLAKSDEIIATPTLVKRLPLPIRRIIGDLTETERILVGLNLVKLDEVRANRMLSALEGHKR